MVSGMHRLLLREGRNNPSNPDFQTFFEGFSTFRQVEISFLGMPQIAHFQVEKWKSSLPWEGGHPLAWPPNEIKPWLIFNSIHANPYSTCRQVEISFLGIPQIAHFQVEKWKSSLPCLPSHTLPALRYLGLGRFAPSQRMRPQNVLAHYATDAQGIEGRRFGGGGGGGGVAEVSCPNIGPNI